MGNKIIQYVQGKLDELDKNFSSGEIEEYNSALLMSSLKDDSTFYLLNEILTSMMMVNPKFASIIKDTYESTPNITDVLRSEHDPMCDYWEKQVRKLKEISATFK